MQIGLKLLKVGTLIALMTCSIACAPRIYVPSLQTIKKGEPAPKDGFFITPEDLKAVGDLKIEKTHE